MPIFEYICQECGVQFEFFLRQRIEQAACPRCQAKAVKKILSAFAYASKGHSGGSRRASSDCSNCVSHNCAQYA
ncbi:MAG: zinc ribbon domain-containing protein, partial [Candidatus Omnitrophica bacterium]|nr:zinc ribbon domain-containing protein [Candidatus Omnitrophota bacterium]